MISKKSRQPVKNLKLQSIDYPANGIDDAAGEEQTELRSGQCRMYFHNGKDAGPSEQYVNQ